MKRRGISVNTVLLAMLIGTVLIVLVSTTLLFFGSYERSLVRSSETNSIRTVYQVSTTVNEYLSETDKIMETIKGTLEDTGVDRGEFFDVFLRIRPDVVAVSTYDGEGNLLRCYSSLGDEPTVSDVNLSFRKEKIGDYAEGYISAPHVETLFTGAYPWVVTMITPLEGAGEERWAALDISCTNISAYINDIGIGRRGYCFLMDDGGNIVYHPQQQLLYSSLKEEDMEMIAGLPDGSCVENNVIYAVQGLRNGRWKVVGVSYVQETISENLMEMGRIQVISGAVILLAMMFVAAGLSRTMSRPIRELASQMEAFEQNAEQFTYTPDGRLREVRILSESFSHMVLRLQELMEKVRDEQINLRKTELKALQAQINPHFLYNTLDSISWMCEQGRNKEAVRMVNALARLFRISISRGHELIPIRSELQHAESYLQIQSYRYRNQFTYAFEADERCLDYLCNKITLQPIIENAIYHGINGLVEDGRILVTVREDGEDILMTVEDNGTGMDAAQIEAVMQKERSDHAGIGIKNVDDRLKIYFGQDYGIRIDSVPDEGTRVMIRMPKVRRERENAQV